MVEALDLRGRPSTWGPIHTAKLLLMAGKYHDREIAAMIEVETGDRFTSDTIGRKRRDLGLEACHSNDWTAPLAKVREA